MTEPLVLLSMGLPSDVSRMRSGVRVVGEMMVVVEDAEAMTSS